MANFHHPSDGSETRTTGNHRAYGPYRFIHDFLIQIRFSTMFDCQRVPGDATTAVLCVLSGNCGIPSSGYKKLAPLKTHNFRHCGKPLQHRSWNPQFPPVVSGFFECFSDLQYDFNALSDLCLDQNCVPQNWFRSYSNWSTHDHHPPKLLRG